MLKKQTDGQWLVDVQPGGRSGPRIRKLFPTRGEATRYETWCKAQVQQGEWKKPRQPKFAELVEHWAGTAKHLGDYEARKRLLDRIAREVEHPNPLTWAKYIAAHQNLSQATQNRHLAYVRAVMNRCLKDGLIKEHPLSHTTPSREKDRGLRVLSKSEILSVLDASEPLKTVIQICLSTGARWEEANGLKPSQIQKNELRFEGTKSGKNRAIPVSDEIRQKLVCAAEGKSPNEAIYKPMYFEVRRHLAGKKIELPPGQMSHVFRHTFAEHYLSSGGNLRDLQEIMGHADIKTTMRYSHFSKERLKSVLMMNPLTATE